MSYVDELRRELQRAGLSARRRRRIVAEFTDHLHSDPKADLGEPAVLARQFADELGSWFARAAAFRAFLALAVTGAAVLGVFLAAGRMRSFTGVAQAGHATASWTAPVLLVAAVAAQVALAAGALALLRAWHLRGSRVISAGDSRILLRRASVGMVAGAVTVLSLLAAALSLPHVTNSALVPGVWIATAASLLCLAAALPTVLAGARTRPVLDGPVRDLRADLGSLLPPSITPLRLALALTFGIAILLTVLGVLADDPYDGALRGLADGAACLVGYALLGGYLGLRAPLT